MLSLLSVIVTASMGLMAVARAPAAWTPERFAGCERMPEHGWDTVTVPGAVDTWVQLSNRFGQLPFEKLFESANLNTLRERVCCFTGGCFRVLGAQREMNTVISRVSELFSCPTGVPPPRVRPFPKKDHGKHPG
ncbi:MAG: hypothetical protein CM1200mP18_07140 [Gammaproteobacteria bacterium]|nr:MAG: hypothetical protein CM1200mP18_07140 [Gammaproteobacteria bacterium]